MTDFFKKTCIAGLVSILPFMSPAQAGDYVLALPDGLHTEDARQVWSLVEDFLYREGQQGDRLIVFNAKSLSSIATFTLPSGEGMDQENRRRRKLADDMAPLVRFFREHYVEPSEPINDTSDDILFPQLMAELSTQTFGTVEDGSRNVCVMVIGDARYLDPREEGAYSMDGQRVPTLGFILGTQVESPYGTLDRQGLLKGLTTHFAYTNEAWESDLFQLRVEYTWWHFLNQQDGMLSTFTPDIRTAQERWINCAAKSTRTFSMDSTRDVKAMMNIARLPGEVEEAIEVEEVITAPQEPEVIAGNTDWLSSETVSVEQNAPATTSGALLVGIRWGDGGTSCSGVDMDIYVRTTPDLPFLSFRQTRTADGRFDKDITATSDLSHTANGLEFVELPNVADFRTLDIRVNHYGGRCEGGVNGELRALYNGAVYTTPFTTPDARGNLGTNIERAASSPHWAVIDPQTLFNLD